MANRAALQYSWTCGASVIRFSQTSVFFSVEITSFHLLMLSDQNIAKQIQNEPLLGSVFIEKG